MVQASDKLPKFHKPPVVEVVLGVQFQRLPMHVGHLGLYWDRVRGQFPQVQQQIQLPHIIERKGIQASNPSPTISFLTPAEQIPRVWIISEDHCELIQLQADRFLRNWRRYHGPAIQYPTYDGHTRPNFERDFTDFLDFAAIEKLPEPVADQCEVTYINVIRPCGVWEQFGQLGKVFKGWMAECPSVASGPPLAVQWRAKHEVVDADGRFVGHLFLELDSAFDGGSEGEPQPVFQLQLIVRGRPLGEGMSGVMRFMDLGHSTIVNSFAEVTTPEMQSVWGRYQ
jgi:uncharacterized protein (TIGR04255 family)